MYITLLIAVPPRFSSDQEKNKTTEEAYPKEDECISSKHRSGIFGCKRGDTQRYEEHSRQTTTLQSANGYMTDWVPSEEPTELSDSQQTMKPTRTKSYTNCHTKDLTESQGGEFICHKQHAEALSEQLVTSLQTAVQPDGFGNLQQTVASEKLNVKTITVQSEELNSSAQTALPSEPGHSRHTSTAQSGHITNHLRISTVKSDGFCNPIERESVQSEEIFKSLQYATVGADELLSSTQMPAVLSENLLHCTQTETIQSEDPCNSLQTLQSADAIKPLQTSTVQLVKLSRLADAASLQSVEMYNSHKAETVQPKGDFNLLQSASVSLNELYETEQAAPNQSEVVHRPTQATEVQADCHQATECSKLHCGQTSSAQVSDSHHVKTESTVQSEEVYLSRKCDSHWGDSVTANKVAVEGDFNG